MVIGRFGIVLSPELATASVRFVFSASFCLLGKSALTIETGKLPSGSFASCRVPPQDATPAARSTPRIPIPIRLRAFRGRAVEALSSKGAGNIPRTLPPPIRLCAAQFRGFLGPKLRSTVVGGEWRPHHITFPLRRESDVRGRAPQWGKAPEE